MNNSSVFTQLQNVEVLFNDYKGAQPGEASETILKDLLAL